MMNRQCYAQNNYVYLIVFRYFFDFTLLFWHNRQAPS
jgi:hypothetical protein